MLTSQVDLHFRNDELIGGKLSDLKRSDDCKMVTRLLECSMSTASACVALAECANLETKASAARTLAYVTPDLLRADMRLGGRQQVA